MVGRPCPPRLLFLLCVASVSFPLSGAEGSGHRLRVKVPPVGLPALSEFPASVVLDSDAAGVQGWSFGVAHDETLLQLLEVLPGAAALSANKGGEPEFNVLDSDIENGPGFTYAAVLSLEDRSVVLPAGNGQELATMRYKILVDPAASSPCVDLTATLAFSEELANDAGSLPVRNVVTAGGQSSPVDTIDGTIAVSCPDKIVATVCEAKDERVTLEFVFSPNVESEDLDFLLLYRDGDQIATLDVDTRSYVDEGVSAGLREYTIITTYFGPSGPPNLVFGYCAVTVAPVTLTGVEPAVGNWLGGELITVRGTRFADARMSSLVLYADGEDPIPLDIVQVVDADTMIVSTPEFSSLGVWGLRLENGNGSAEAPNAFEVGFVRGDANADRATDISDAIFVLDFLFLGGAAPPRCRDAGDVNDSGSIDVSDAVAMLAALFQGGPPIPAPFPAPGRDPTGNDAVGCLE